MAFNLDDEEEILIILHETDGRYLLFEDEAEAQLSINNLKHRKSKHPGYFVIITGPESAVMCVYLGYHSFLFFLKALKSTPVRTLAMEQFMISPNLVFFAHEYFQHAVAECYGHYCFL